MDPKSFRRSLVGAAWGGGLFGAVSVYRSWVAPGSLLDYAGPVGLLVVIGATVGGLVAPLLGEVVDRRREKRSRESASTGEPQDVDSGKKEELEGPAGRPPAWVTLLAGAGVGLGAGLAWERPVVGVALGVALALAARRIFR